MHIFILCRNNSLLWLPRVIFAFCSRCYICPVYSIFSFRFFFFLQNGFLRWEVHGNHKYEAAIYLMIILNDNATYFVYKTGCQTIFFAACFARCSGPLHFICVLPGLCVCCHDETDKEQIEQWNMCVNRKMGGVTRKLIRYPQAIDESLSKTDILLCKSRLFGQPHN